MKTHRILFASVATVAASFAFGQNASFTSDTQVLAQSGGTVALRAVVEYEGEPGALGWTIALPADWSLVVVSGPNVPSIAPEAGSTGPLEFAYTAVPANRAEFSVVVRYPANPASTQAASTVLLRSGGKLTTLTPTPVQMRGVDASASRQSRN